MGTSTTSISEKIREAIRRHPSIYFVAKGSGVAHPVICRFLSGERDIRVATAERLADFLGLVLIEANPQGVERTANKVEPSAKGKGKGTARNATAGKATTKRGKATTKRARK